MRVRRESTPKERVKKLSREKSVKRREEALENENRNLVISLNYMDTGQLREKRKEYKRFEERGLDMGGEKGEKLVTYSKKMQGEIKKVQDIKKTAELAENVQLCRARFQKMSKEDLLKNRRHYENMLRKINENKNVPQQQQGQLSTQCRKIIDMIDESLKK